MAEGTQLLSVSNRFMVFDLNSGDLVRVINPGIEGIMQALSVSADTKYCVSFSNRDSIVVCNLISGEFTILKRFTTPMPEPVESKKPVEKNKSLKKAPVSRYSQPLAVKQETDAAKAQARLKVARANYKDYTDTLIGLHASNNYFVVYSKFFIYVYAAKNARLVKVQKLTVPIVQIEVIENNATILQYGLELEVITRDRDLKEDEEVDREYLVVYYLAVVDPEKCRIDEEEAIGLYTPSAEPLECHSCVRLTRSKKKLFTCTEIDDNVVECFRNRPVRKNKTTKNVWRYFTKFNCMSLMNNNFKANDDKITFLMPDILRYLLCSYAAKIS